MLLAIAATYVGAIAAHAQNATWVPSLGSEDFDTAANWSPAIVPTGTATFGASNTTSITFSNLATNVGTLQFNPGAPAYSFNIPLGSNLDPNNLTLTGTGIVNNSSNPPTITSDEGETVFANASTAANARINSMIGETAFENGSLINGGTIQVSAAPGEPVAAVTTSGGATIANQSGGMITGFGLIAIQSSSGTATITNSGVISGTVGIALSNGGTVTNNAGGTISGSNGIAIASSGGSTNLSNSGIINGNVALGNGAGTVQLFSGSRISGSLNLGPSSGSNLILDGSGNQTYSQAVTGATISAGSLTKQGSGNWLIDVAMNAPVSTKVLAGVLTVDGSLNSPLVTVQTGGMLKGSGVIIGNVVNVGTLAPGNSPGTLTVNGNFTQGPAGIYNVEIASAQDYSRLVVSGSATLNGTLHLTLASGFQPAPGERFTILTAAKGISGTFRTVSTSTPVNVIYSNGDVDVSAPPSPKPQIHLSDGTPVSTTALLADYTFYGFGSLSQRDAQGLLETGEPPKNSAISITFDAGEFDIEGQHGKNYTIPIAGSFKVNDRVRLDIPFAKSWIVEPYLIYTQFLQSAATGNYYTIGADVGRHFTWNVEGETIDLGYLSLGLYTESGNHYSSGHVQIGSAWRF